LNNEEYVSTARTSDCFEDFTEQPNHRKESTIDEIEMVQDASTSKENEEIFNTFTNELAYTAYISISRLNSGVYIDSILTNADLIHQMCLQDEKKRQRSAREQIRNNKYFEFFE
jgi:hypothetical protein